MIWIIGDTHHGCRNNSTLWLDIIETAHNDFIYKTIKNECNSDDIIIMLGDVFDSRKSINLRSIEFVIDFYTKLSSLCKEVHIIVGNHDIYKKDTTDITSLAILENIKGVNVHREISNISYDNTSLFFMPWRKNVKEESETLKSNSADYAFMHGTFCGAKYNQYVTIEKDHGASTSSTKNYKRVYTGHIHYSQQIKNINIVGTPYELTRGDRDNKKGIWKLNHKTNEEFFYENDISPKHILYNVADLEDLKDIEATKDFIDIDLPEELLSSNYKKITKIFESIREVAYSLTVSTYNNKSIHPIVDEIINNQSDHDKVIYDEIENSLPEDQRKEAHKIIENILKDL